MKSGCVVVCTDNGACMTIIIIIILSYNTDASGGSGSADLVSGLEVCIIDSLISLHYWSCIEKKNSAK